MIGVEKLIDIGLKVIEKAKEFGADELEIFLASTDILSMRVITNYVTTRRGLDIGVGIRAVVGKRVGFASASSISEDTIFETAKNAVKIAKTRPEDPDFHHLPDPKKPSFKGGICDEELVSKSSEELINIAEESIKKGFEKNPSIKKIDYNLTKQVGSFAVVNTRGVEVGDSYTLIASWASVKAEKNSEAVTAFEIFNSRKYEEELLLSVSEKAAERALRIFGGKRLEKSFSGQMLIENYVVDDFLWPITYNVNARNVQEKRSGFMNKLNEQVANEKLTIIDDGTLPEGLMTFSVDMEGVPTSKKVLIDKGVLKTFVYDSYTAYREGKESTGNAMRRSFESLPEPSTVNIVIESTTNKDVHGLLGEIDKGVYIAGFTMGSHLTDPLRGTFSITSLNAFYVENGDIKYPLKSVTAGGNFFELLKNVISVGSDYRLIRLGKIPSILVDKITFV
ncbi:MAG: TldD/PmbA family protein [Candidatus Njordarchaeales archaeon]